MEAFSVDGMLDSFPGFDDILFKNDLPQHCGFAKEEPPMMEFCIGPMDESSDTHVMQYSTTDVPLTEMILLGSPHASVESKHMSSEAGLEAVSRCPTSKADIPKKASRERRHGAADKASRRSSPHKQIIQQQQQEAPPVVQRQEEEVDSDFADFLAIVPKMEQVFDDDDDDLCGKAGANMSHSTVEKRRRDRINNLIDMLSERVPPLSSKYRQSNSTGVRRPKHIVLSDTLSLLSKIKNTLQGYEHKVARLTAEAESATAALAKAMAAGPEAAAAASYPTTPCIFVPKAMSSTSLARSNKDEPAPKKPHLMGAQALYSDVMNRQNRQQKQCPSAVLPLLGAPKPLLPSVRNATSSVPMMVAHSEPAQVNKTQRMLVAASQPPPVLELHSLPYVSVQEVSPGRHHVKITCLDRPDLRSDIAESLGAMPVTLSRAAFSVAPPPPLHPSSLPSAFACDGKTNIAQIEMLVDALEASGVTSEQLQLSLHMSVCFSCPLMADPSGAGVSMGSSGCLLPCMGGCGLETITQETWV